MNATISRIFAAIAWFFRWWFSQLAELVPGPIRRVLGARPDVVLVDLSGPEVRVLRCGAERCEEVGRFPAAPDGQVGGEEESRVRRVLTKAGTGRHRTALRLSGEHALRKSLTLPLAAEGELSSLLYHQIEQLTPFRADEACFGYRVENRDLKARQIAVEMTVVPRRFVDAAIEGAERWNLHPDIVDVHTGDATRLPAINLIADARAQSASLWPRITGLLAVLALILTLIAVFIPAQHARARAEALLAQAAELRRASTKVLALRRERDSLERQVRFLVAKKEEARRVLDTLAELTRIIPEGSWLSQIRVDRKEVRIWGYSPSASSLIGKINGSNLFVNPRFRSPVTRAAGTAEERFNISFELRGSISGEER